MKIAKSKLKRLIKEEIINIKIVDNKATDATFKVLLECAEHLTHGKHAEYKKALLALNKLSTEL